MEEVRTYLDLLKDQAGVMERIDLLVEEQIAAKMRVEIERGLGPDTDYAEISIFHKDLLTNKIKYTFVSLNNNTSTAKIIRNKILNKEVVETYTLHDTLEVNSEPGYDWVTLWDGKLGVQVDKALFLRLLEEYVDMVENEENGELIITTKREVIKNIV